MKTIPVLEDTSWSTGDHPDTGKPLSAFRQVTAICNDCGHARTLDQDALRELRAVPTLDVLARHAHCSACREAGATGRTNLEFRTVPVEDKATRAVNWSREAIFTDNRTDPRPNLPRRNVFDRRLPKLERMR